MYAAEIQTKAPSMPALIYLFLLTFITHITTLAAAEQAFSASADETAVSLQASLATGGLEQPQALAGILRGLGLPSVQDVRLLNIPEHLELSKSLQEQGVNLGSRSKLRRLSEGDNEVPAGLLYDNGVRSADSRTSHRRAQDAPAKAESSGFSMETLAIAVTALLGVVSYVLQAKLARDAETTDKEHDRYLVSREKDRVQADRLLERVRASLADALFPMITRLLVGVQHEVGLQYELALPLGKKRHLDKQFVRPLALWPHVVVQTRAPSPEFMGVMSASPFFSYGAEDLAVLADNKDKTERFVEAFRDCILPQYRAWSDLYAQSRHLLDLPAPDLLSKPFAAAGIDWAAFSGWSLANLALDMAQYVGAWAPILKRWANADFSDMQPAAPNYGPALMIITVTMVGAAGQKEKVGARWNIWTVSPSPHFSVSS